MGFKEWIVKEPVKLGLASLAIALIKICMSSLTPLLAAAAQSYGENHHVNFTTFASFSKLCGSSVTCAIAGALLVVHGKKPFVMKAPLYAYAVIATAAALATAAENQLNHGIGEDWNLTWQCSIVFAVMGFQMLMLRQEFSWWNWLISTVFLCACFVSALPWVSSKANNTNAWQLAVFVAFVYLGMEALNQTYQDKLFCELGTAITEQVFFISLFTTIIRIIGFLWEFRRLETIVFHAKHPLSSFATVLVLSFMGAAMAFLMSYMLQLCGALICVMIHQITVNILGGKSQELNLIEHAFKWIGITIMLGMLATTMLNMQHNHHHHGKIQLSSIDMDLEELGLVEFDDKSSLEQEHVQKSEHKDDVL